MIFDKGGNIFTENTLSIIIAVLCLLVIGYAAFNLYQTSIQESKSAETVLDTVIVRANALEDGQSITTTVQGFKEADEWYLVGWSKDNPSKPEKCYRDYDNGCLCICKGGSPSDCQEGGICKEVEVENVLAHTLPFNVNFLGPIKKGGIMHRACIPLARNLIEFNISKSAETFNLSKGLGKEFITIDPTGFATPEGDDKIHSSYLECYGLEDDTYS